MIKRGISAQIVALPSRHCNPYFVYQCQLMLIWLLSVAMYHRPGYPQIWMFPRAFG